MSALEASFWPRLEIWTNSFFTWLDAPLFGHGIGGYEFAYAPHRADHWQYFPDMGTIMASLAIHAGSAHNEILQALIEIGSIGVLLAAWFLYSALKGSRHRSRWAVVTALTILLIEFPLQNPASALLIAVALGLASRAEPSPSLPVLASDTWGCIRGRVRFNLPGFNRFCRPTP